MPVQCAPIRFATLNSFSLSAVQFSCSSVAGKRCNPPTTACTGWFGNCSRANVRMLMIPAWPQPVTTTNPSGVLSTRDWSSGIVSSTRSAEVCTFPVLLQLCSGYLRGTGPVSHAPGKISAASSCSINFPSRGFILLLQCNHLVLFTLLRWPAVKNTAGDMNYRQCARISFHHFFAESHQATDMIPVIVRKDHLFHVRQINLQVACILQYGIGSGPGIEQNAVPICLDQRRKSPLAYTRNISDQHGRKQGHFQRVNLRRGVLGARRGTALGPRRRHT